MKLGTKDKPYLIAPRGFVANGLPLDSYCKCSKCGIVAPSTFNFDFYVKKDGEYLTCEKCFMLEVSKEINKNGK